MNKKVLIISPYFPPSNTADMQRIRMSLPYFRENGWEAEVVAVDSNYASLYNDDLLIESIPPDIKIHYVKAFDKSWTSKLGFGSISYRSYWFYEKEVAKLLKSAKYDLIYFSTTQFQLCILGYKWKKKFKIPYIIDIQDMWYSEYYVNKPKEQRNSKFWVTYYLNKYLEPLALKRLDGLISVSENYISILKARYPQIKEIPSATITFGAFDQDLKIAAKHNESFKPLLKPGTKNIVYIGRGGMDLHEALKPVFETFKKKLEEDSDGFKRVMFYFIGTSYAPLGQGKATISPLAGHYKIEENVVEITDRMGYYHALATLQQADAFFIPGSDDPNYTASKIYPYLLNNKPLLAVFNSKSSALRILEEYGAKDVYSFDKTKDLEHKISIFLKRVASGEPMEYDYKAEAIKKYSAQMMTKHQCDLFNEVIDKV